MGSRTRLSLGISWSFGLLIVFFIGLLAISHAHPVRDQAAAFEAVLQAPPALKDEVSSLAADHKHRGPRDIPSLTQSHGHQGHFHDDEAMQVSSVFPVDPVKLEQTLHHQHNHPADSVDKLQEVSRQKRSLQQYQQQQLQQQWVDDVGQAVRPDAFRYYINGGEMQGYQEDVQQPAIQSRDDPQVNDYFMSEITQHTPRYPTVRQPFFSELTRGAAAASTNYVNDESAANSNLVSEIPVHVVSHKKMTPAAGINKRGSISVAGNSIGTDSPALLDENQLEAALIPAIANTLAREQAIDWQKLYEHLPHRESNVHPPALNSTISWALGTAAAFLVTLSATALYVLKPTHIARKERAEASRTCSERVPPIEVANMNVEDMKALLE